MTLCSNPCLSLYMGTPGQKEEAAYDLWKYEVNCLHAEGGHGDDAMMEATRQSLKPLKGEAAHVAMQLGPKTTINNLLDEFGSIYTIIAW